MERQAITKDYVALTIDRDSEFIQLYNVAVSPQILDYTEILKANNVKINYCCTDSPQQVLKLFEYGVDFVLVNELDKIMKAME